MLAEPEEAGVWVDCSQKFPGHQRGAKLLPEALCGPELVTSRTSQEFGELGLQRGRRRAWWPGHHSWARWPDLSPSTSAYGDSHLRCGSSGDQHLLSLVTDDDSSWEVERKAQRGRGPQAGPHGTGSRPRGPSPNPLSPS